LIFRVLAFYSSGLGIDLGMVAQFESTRL
jgi:hypothetical protein